jgi:hypothetical protein
MLAKAGLVAGGVAAAVLHADLARAQTVGETMDIAPPAGDAALRLRPSGNVAPSTSVGGALNLDNSASRGAGAVLYSNQGADALGRLLVVNQANPANPQHAVRIQNSGTSHTISILHDPAGGAGDPSAEALDIVSTNPLDTTLGVQGREEGRGTVKITHEKPLGVDANASAISIALLGAGTACQGIFIGNDAGNKTTGKLLNIRNGGPGTDRLVLTADGHLTIAGQMVLTDVDKLVANANYTVARVDPSTTITLDNGGGLRGVALSPAVSANGILAPTSLSMFDLTTIVTPTGKTNLNAIEAYRCAPQINGLPGVAGGVTGSTFSSFEHEVRLRPITGGTA